VIEQIRQKDNIYWDDANTFSLRFGVELAPELKRLQELGIIEGSKLSVDFNEISVKANDPTNNPAALDTVLVDPDSLLSTFAEGRSKKYAMEVNDLYDMT